MLNLFWGDRILYLGILKPLVLALLPEICPHFSGLELTWWLSHRAAHLGHEDMCNSLRSQDLTFRPIKSGLRLSPECLYFGKIYPGDF